MPTELF